MKNKRGQVSMGDAPQIVMIVGLVFLLMATLAYIGYQYQQGFGASNTATIVNETVTQLERNTNSYLDGASYCNAQSFAITNVTNGTGNLQVASTNYTLSSTGQFTNTTGSNNWGASPSWRVSYTVLYAGAECNITTALGTQINNNTSIAGIVLTIALVGIVLSILIGVFVLVGRRKV